MATEKTDSKTEVPPPVVPARRSMTDIAFGIISTLVATAIGAYIGNKIGSWGDRPGESHNGITTPAGKRSAQIFATIMGVFSGLLAFGANFRNSPQQEGKNTSMVPEKAAEEKKLKHVVGEDDSTRPNAKIAGAVMHDGAVQELSKKVAI